MFRSLPVRVVGTQSDTVAGPDGAEIPLIDLRPEPVQPQSTRSHDLGVALLVIVHGLDGKPAALVLRPLPQRPLPQDVQPRKVLCVQHWYYKWNRLTRLWLRDPVWFWISNRSSSGTGRHIGKSFCILATEVVEEYRGKSADVWRYTAGRVQSDAQAPIQEPTAEIGCGRNNPPEIAGSPVVVSSQWNHDHSFASVVDPGYPTWEEIHEDDVRSRWEHQPRDLPQEVAGIALTALEAGEIPVLRPQQVRVFYWATGHGGDRMKIGHNFRVGVFAWVVNVGGTSYRLSPETVPDLSRSPTEAAAEDLRKHFPSDRGQRLCQELAQARSRAEAILAQLRQESEAGYVPERRVETSRVANPDPLPAHKTPAARFAELVAQRLEAALASDPRLALQLWDEAQTPPPLPSDQPQRGSKVDLATVDLTKLFGGNVRIR